MNPLIAFIGAVNLPLFAGLASIEASE